jgi:hypothetical protein
MSPRVLREGGQVCVRTCVNGGPASAHFMHLPLPPPPLGHLQAPQYLFRGRWRAITRLYYHVRT